jgi:hypothetical protein
MFENGQRRRAPAALLLMLPMASGMAAAVCPAGAQWTEPAYAMARYEAPWPMSTSELHRYTNAMRVDFARADGASRAILVLENGPELIFGSRNPQEFLDAPLGVMLPVIYLQQHYPTPCATPPAEDFAFRIERDGMFGGGPAEVSGTLHRTGHRIDYTLHVVPAAQAAKAPLNISGSFIFESLTAIPEDTDVRGAQVVVGMALVEGAAPATVAEARQSAKH